jgi:hypothetical protein
MNWTQEEDLILKLNYENMQKSQLEKLLPNRTWSAIQLRGKRIFKLNRENFKRHIGNDFAKGLKHIYKPKHSKRIGKQEYISNRGYKYIQTGDISSNNSGWSCYRPEHILIIENFLGRKIKRDSKGNGEGVHHINGNKLDNNIENLLLYNDEVEHKNLHNQLQELSFLLVQKGFIAFDKQTNKYFINE